MLTFYPEFETRTLESIQIIFMLDLSHSMEDTALAAAKKVILLSLRNLPEGSTFNMVGFGTGNTYCKVMFP